MDILVIEIGLLENDLAYLYAQENVKLDEALVLIHKAIKTKPGNGAYQDTLGWVLYKQERYNESVFSLKQAINIKSDSPEILDHLGCAYKALNKIRKAKEQWQKALELTNDEKLKKKIQEELRNCSTEPSPPTRLIIPQPNDS